MDDDYYGLLGVSRDASDSELKKAYRKKAMQFHPDRNPGDTVAEENFKSVSEAYQVLSDSQKRQIYDRYGVEGLKNQGAGGGFSDVGDIFSSFGDLFGDLFGFGRQSARHRGDDLRLGISMTMEEALSGVERTVSIQRQFPCDPCAGTGAKPGTEPAMCATCRGQGQVVVNRGFISMTTTCPKCQGAGRIIRHACRACRGSGFEEKTDRVTIKVPAGISDGMKLRLTGRGQAGPPGSEPGDLYVVCGVEDHPRFERHGPELLGELNVPMVLACLGGEIDFETLDSTEAVNLDAGTQPGEIIRLRGHGMPHLDRRPGRGDLHLRVAVTIPTDLTDRQRELLASFDDE
jgi:molecular chaperone DnaJ